MHCSVLNRATVRVADTRDVSGRLTADSINDGSRAERKSSLWRACRLMIFCSVVSVGVLASLTPVPALADDEEGGVRQEIAALKKQVAALQSEVQTLQTELAAVQSNKALALGPFVKVDPNPENGVIGPNIVFSGANIHILSGSGATDDGYFSGGKLTGRGNLIIGYDEISFGQPNRRGSHNLVIGPFHNFTSSALGGLVVGEENTISAPFATVSGGQANFATALFASVSGGAGNLASGVGASVSGGDGNRASGLEASVSGGLSNKANGEVASVSGGSNNTASGLAASVSGGSANTASGGTASVTGGLSNTASGDATIVIGKVGVTNDLELNIRPEPPF